MQDKKHAVDVGVRKPGVFKSVEQHAAQKGPGGARGTHNQKIDDAHVYNGFLRKHTEKVGLRGVFLPRKTQIADKGEQA